MYNGKIIEIAKKDEIINNAIHPYTRLLLSVTKNQKNDVVNDMCNNINNQNSGCIYTKKCSYATEKCYKYEPGLKKYSEDHNVACWKV